MSQGRMKAFDWLEGCLYLTLKQHRKTVSALIGSIKEHVFHTLLPTISGLDGVQDNGREVQTCCNGDGGGVGYLTYLGSHGFASGYKRYQFVLCIRHYIFLNFFQFNFIIYSDIPYLLSRTLICKKKNFINMTYSNFVQYVPSDWESVLTEQ